MPPSRPYCCSIGWPEDRNNLDFSWYVGTSKHLGRVNSNTLTMEQLSLNHGDVPSAPPEGPSAVAAAAASRSAFSFASASSLAFFSRSSRLNPGCMGHGETNAHDASITNERDRTDVDPYSTR